MSALAPHAYRLEEGWFFGVTAVPMLDLHEIAAGKLAALFARAASRDLFDVRELLGSAVLETEKLRLGFVVYGGINRRDWRNISLDDVSADPTDVDRQLVPLLRAHAAPRRTEIWIGPSSWCQSPVTCSQSRCH